MAKRLASLVMTAAASCLTITAVAQEGFMDAGKPERALQ